MTEPAAPGPTNAAQPSGPPKKETATWLLALAGLIGFCLLSGIGSAMGYAGTALGVLGAGGLVFVALKGKPERKKMLLVGAGAFAVLALFGVFGAQTRLKKAADAVATQEASNRKAEQDAAERQKLLSRLAEGAAVPSTEVVSTCERLDKLGGSTPDAKAKCSDALLGIGKALLAEKKYREAVAILWKLGPYCSGNCDETFSACE